MDLEKLNNPEFLEKLKSVKTLEELKALAQEEGVELSDEQLEAVSGGFDDCNNLACAVDHAIKCRVLFG
jgi:hypothetical protein